MIDELMKEHERGSESVEQFKKEAQAILREENLADLLEDWDDSEDYEKDSEEEVKAMDLIYMSLRE